MLVCDTRALTPDKEILFLLNDFIKIRRTIKHFKKTIATGTDMKPTHSTLHPLTITIPSDSFEHLETENVKTIVLLMDSIEIMLLYHTILM